MKHPLLTACLLAPLLVTTGCVSDDFGDQARTLLGSTLSASQGAGLSTEQITLGLKEALNVGTRVVVAQLGRTGGFNLDPTIRIPLPPAFTKADAALKAVGLGKLTGDLENKMNEAAELAVPQAQALFVNAISKMTIADARNILSGQQDAATQYLRQTMGAELATKIQPIVTNTLAQTGAVQAYDRVLGQYAALPFLSNVKTDLNNYVTNKALDGVFYYVAQEESAIRQDPAKRTTEILKTVFGSR